MASIKLFQIENLCTQQVNSLPNNKILDWSNLKAFADDKMNLNEKLKVVLQRLENILGKEKMLVTNIFSYSQNVFKNLLFQGC